MTLLQIAIALASITVLTQKRWLLAGRGIAAAGGPRSASSPGSEAGLMLQVRGLAKSFAGHAALRRVDLEVARGEWVAIVGESGSASPRC
jgi:ABC-type multidrug transport system fused ATPase/permease subunit